MGSEHARTGFLLNDGGRGKKASSCLSHTLLRNTWLNFWNQVTWHKLHFPPPVIRQERKRNDPTPGLRSPEISTLTAIYCHSTGRFNIPIRADSCIWVSNTASQFTGNEFQFKQDIKILLECTTVYTSQKRLLQEFDQLKVVSFTCANKRIMSLQHNMCIHN